MPDDSDPHDFGVDDYFRRIGYTGPRVATMRVLEDLVAAHVRRIPFEGIDPMLGVPVASLDAGTLQDKLIRRSRGGYCFEQNGLLAYALAGLGFDVDALAGRVVWMKDDVGELSAETHQLLRVRAPDTGEVRLADVGFGGQTPTAPLHFVLDHEQPTDHGSFRVTRDDVRTTSPYAVETLIDSTWRPVYFFDDRPRPRIDLEVASWYVSTLPTSHFVTGLNAAIVTDDARWNLRGRNLSVHRVGEATVKSALTSATAVMDLLVERFGIDTAIPGLAERLESVLDT